MTGKGFEPVKPRRLRRISKEFPPGSDMERIIQEREVEKAREIASLALAAKRTS